MEILFAMSTLKNLSISNQRKEIQDTINVNFKEFINFHVGKKALLSMALARSSMSKDYGTVVLDNDNSSKIINFNEKSVGNNNDALINAGVYIMQKEVFSYMPKQKTFSLEYDLFPKLCNRFYGFIIKGEVIDIGTPERYERAIHLIGDI